MSLIDTGLNGRTAMVFGGSSGLGFASAQALASEGSNVVLLSRNFAKVTAAAQAIADQYGVQATGLSVDITDEKALAECLASNPDIDVLVTNCGGPPIAPLESFTLETWDHAWQSQMRSVVQACSALLPGMAQRGWGRVVMISSITVVFPMNHFGLSNSIRPGLLGLAATLTQEYAAKGITANIVCPGITATDRINTLVDSLIEGGQTREQANHQMTGSIPSARMGKPEELGEAVAFLASDKAAFITGQSLVIDGGHSVNG